MKKHAFTLAETLITLVIIGVVAAMTIPTLMSKYQEKALESQFKKSYAMITQAISLNSQYECYRDEVNWTESGHHLAECSEFWENVLSNLKIVKTENYNAFKSNIPYKTGEEVISEGGTSYVTRAIIDDGATKKHYLSDGSVIYVTTYIYAHWDTPLMIVIDVNGDKGPNKWGYDVFNLRVTKKTNNTLILSDNGISVKEKGGKTVNDIILGIKK